MAAATSNTNTNTNTITYTQEDESKNYKNAIRRGRRDSETQEWMSFLVVDPSKPATEEPKRITLRFRFEWLYESGEGLTYTKLVNFKGHKRRKEADREWLENYARRYFPDPHHMSY